MVIRLTGVTKRFPGVLANDAISLEFRAGEVHCLLGENGAGKSTLISLLAGLQQPDDGEIAIDGAPVRLTSPAVALGLGIGVVYQHSTLIPSLTVLENLLLGETKRFRIDRAAAVARLSELAGVLGVHIDPHRLAGDLGLGEQQQLEIVKAMWRGSRVLILDEPTSMLVPQAVQSLMRSIHRLRADGVAVVLVTHKLGEVYAIADAVTVLRAGRVVDSIPPEVTREQGEDRVKSRILAAMFGEGRGEASPVQTVDLRRPREVHGPVVLRVESLSTVPERGETAVNGVSFEVHSGEIVGIAGIDGEGQKHLAEAIAGQRALDSGSVSLDGTPLDGRSVRARHRLGLRYVTDDRLNEGIVAGMSVALNLVLNRIGDAPLWRFGRMNRDAVNSLADERIAAYNIRTPSREARAGTLSGGNMQKLLLARELADDPRAVMFNKPSYGLDLRTVAQVRDTVRSYAAGGGAVLLISTDLDELNELADRVLVMSDGRIVGELSNDGSGIAEHVGALMVGGRA